MKRQFPRVAVLGSGVMGSAIAAHFANAGIPSLVLDIVPPELSKQEQAAGLTLENPRVRNRIAAQSLKQLARARPAALFSATRMAMIEIGNLEDDLARLADADWVIEAVREDPAIKKRVFESVAPHIGPDAVLSTNTSGLSLEKMSADLPANLRPRFLGTHFFNPPRYMRLLELIPTGETSPEVLDAVSTFARDRLGKGIVHAKDTPNFVANRIGVHGMMAALHVMQEMELTIEEIDAVTGPALGRPKSATFRLADMVGLDTLMFVAQTVYRAAPDDEARDLFEVPDFMKQMVERKMLGQKTGGGFYKRVRGPKKEILTIDTGTLEYRERIEPALTDLAPLRKIAEVGDRIRTMVDGDGRGSTAGWKILASTLSYSAMRLGEIADDAATIDRAMKLGFNWELGPFETWDRLGFRETADRMREDGFALPKWVDELQESGATSLYVDKDGERQSPTSVSGATVAIPTDPRSLSLAVLRGNDKVVRSNRSASLLDLGEGVLCLEFHSKMNAIDDQTLEMTNAAVEEAESGWQAIVVGNQGDNFSAGANLMMLAEAAQKGDWKKIDTIVRGFQEATNRLELCAVPVVTVPHGMALGGGCEVSLAGNAIRASAETYMGLVEVGAGLVPAGGGCLRLYQRNVESLPDPKDLFPALKKTFEAIAMARVSGSAEEARNIGFLRSGDGWSMNADHRLADARDIALAMARSNFVAPGPAAALPVMGRAGMAIIESMLVNMHEGRFISDHDRKIGRTLAGIVCGGDVPGPTTASAQHILDLEREAFLKLCGEPKTHERVRALLETGKPLRN